MDCIPRVLYFIVIWVEQPVCSISCFAKDSVWSTPVLIYRPFLAAVSWSHERSIRQVGTRILELVSHICSLTFVGNFPYGEVRHGGFLQGSWAFLEWDLYLDSYLRLHSWLWVLLFSWARLLQFRRLGGTGTLLLLFALCCDRLRERCATVHTNCHNTRRASSLYCLQLFCSWPPSSHCSQDILVLTFPFVFYRY